MLPSHLSLDSSVFRLGSGGARLQFSSREAGESRGRGDGEMVPVAPVRTRRRPFWTLVATRAAKVKVE